MRPVVSSAQMREIDRLTSERHGVPSGLLMENAAEAVVRAITTHFPADTRGNSVLVLCGRGNNGGDGAAVARLLALAGARVDVILIGKLANTKGDARINFDRLIALRDEQARREDRARSGASDGISNLYECDSEQGWDQLLAGLLSTPPDIVVDALLGTGPTRPLEGLYRRVVDHLNRIREACAGVPAYILSIDIPSGLNSDSGEPIGEAVHADVTVTMTSPKVANVLPPAADYNGELIVADIGSPAELVDAAHSQIYLADESDARRWLTQTRYTPDSYKNTHGHALIVAGSRGFTGAAALCGNAAMRAGAGLVTIATPASVQPMLAVQVMPEVMTAELAETDRGTVSDEAVDYVLRLGRRAQVIAIGPGLSSEDERTRKFVRALIEQRTTPVVIDADGLNCLAPWPSSLHGSQRYPIVLTPHPGEMLRLMGTEDKSALSDRLAVARQFATEYEVILVLKGRRAMIAAPDGSVVINSTGNAGLGTAGAGDTLTGVIAGFLAQAYGTLRENADALRTVVAALYVSGLAGDLAARELGMRAMTASDVREHLSNAIRQLDPRGEAPK